MPVQVRRRTGGRRSVRFEVGWCIFKIVYNYCCTYSEGGVVGVKPRQSISEKLACVTRPLARTKRFMCLAAK